MSLSLSLWMKKRFVVIILCLLILGVFGLLFAFQSRPYFSPDSSDTITCPANHEDNACAIYSHALLNGELHGMDIVPGLIYRIIDCLVNKKNLPNPRIHGLKRGNIEDLLDCKENIMLDEYGITENLVYTPNGELSNPFITGSVIKAAPPIECVVGRVVVLEIAIYKNIGSGTQMRVGHMIKCIIEECRKRETILVCQDYISQRGNQYTLTVNSLGGIRTNPDTAYNGGSLEGVIYVR